MNLLLFKSINNSCVIRQHAYLSNDFINLTKYVYTRFIGKTLLNSQTCIQYVSLYLSMYKKANILHFSITRSRYVCMYVCTSTTQPG